MRPMRPAEQFRSWAEKTNGSVGKLAKAVLERAEQEGRPLQTSYKTLHQSLRRWTLGEVPLARGQEHVAIRQHVAAVFGVGERELFPEPIPVDTALFISELLPEMGAFDPRRHDPCRMAWVARRRNPGGLRSAAVHEQIQIVDCFNPDQRVWFHTPPGVGRSFAMHWHRHRWLDRPWKRGRPSAPVPLVLTLESFDDAHSHPDLQDRDQARPVVIEVSRGGGEAGVEAMLERIDQCLVLSPVPLPAQTGLRDVETFANITTVASWRPDRAWRETFVRWVAARLDAEGRLDGHEPDDIVGLLDKLDPWCRLFDTPHAILSAFRLVLDYGENALEEFNATLAEDFVGDEMGRRAGGVKPAYRKLVLEGLRRGAVKAWDNRSQRWLAERTRSLWNELLLAETTSARKPRKAEQSLPDPASALIDAGFLRESSPAQYLLTPAWISAAMAREHLRATVCDPASREWALHALDPSRQFELDHVLANLEWDELVSLVERVLSNFSDARLPDVAAVESLFLAVGGRIESASLSAREKKMLRRLVDQQVALLLPRPHPETPVPQTRAGLGDGVRGGAHFASTCWRWSFSALEHTVDATLAWLFPGWSTPSLPALPNGLRAHNMMFVDDEFAAIERAGLEHFIRLAPRVIARCDDARCQPSYLPLFLKAAVLIDYDRRTEMLVRLLELSLNDHGLSRLLSEYVEALSQARQKATMAALWSLLVRTTLPLIDLLLAFSDIHQRSHRRFVPGGSSPSSPMTQRLLNVVSAEDLATLVRRDAPWNHNDLIALVMRAPAGTESTLLQTALECTPEAERAQLTHALLTLVNARSDLRPTIRPWISGGGLGPQVVPELWRIDPEGSAAFALEAWRDHGSLDPWLTYFDPQQLSHIIEVFERVPERPMPGDWQSWLAQQLCASGPLGDRIWALLARERERAALTASTN